MQSTFQHDTQWDRQLKGDWKVQVVQRAHSQFIVVEYYVWTKPHLAAILHGSGEIKLFYKLSYKLSMDF